MNDLTRKQAFSVVELMVTVFCAVILALVVGVQALKSFHRPVSHINCNASLRQLGMAYTTWAVDHGGDFPASVSESDGGLFESLTNGNQGRLCWKLFNVMSNDLGMWPRILVCPSDIRKPLPPGPLTDRMFLNSNINLSYFAGIGANDRYPGSILGGDRNLAPGLVSGNDFGYSPKNGLGNDVTLSTNPAVSPICWSLKMHSKGTTNEVGNILFADGSVQMVSSSDLRAKIQPRAGAPFVKGHAANALQSSTFRLLFP